MEPDIKLIPYKCPELNKEGSNGQIEILLAVEITQSSSLNSLRHPSLEPIGIMCDEYLKGGLCSSRINNKDNSKRYCSCNEFTQMWS